MSFLKTKKFWIPFSVVGVGIVAIGTGVGLHQKHQNAINIYEGNSRGEIRTKLRNALNTINANDIRVNLNASGINRKSLTQTASESGLYAFNVQTNQLGLSSNVSVPSGIQIGFELDKEKNTLQTLNDGILNIKLIATTPFSNQVETRDLALNTFKKADEKLNRLVNQNNTNSVLEIKQTNGSVKYKTIEQLNRIENSISGLTTLYRSTIQNSNDLANVTIDGEIKLEKIVKQEQTVYFYLTAANNQWLKLVNKQNETTSETLFKQIKLTHLLASEIIPVPNGYTNPATAEFANKLRTSLKDPSRTLAVTVPNMTAASQTNTNNQVQVNIKPYVVVNPQNSETLTTAVQVVFGNKVYDTNRVNDLNTLKEAGFKFNIYSKKLMKKDKELAATDITGSNGAKKLETFFKKENFISPVTKPSKEIFECGSLDTQNMKSIQINTKPMQQQRSRANMNEPMQNYLILADYSYTGLDSGDKVVLTPTLSVVHLEKTIIHNSQK